MRTNNPHHRALLQHRRPGGWRRRTQWAKSIQTYETIGKVGYEFATLTDYRGQIPAPPAPPRFVLEKGADNLEIMIDAPIKAVYQTLVNVDKRPEWLDGVDTIDREMTTERINMRHNCVFHGLKLINTAIFRDFSKERASYSEKVEIPEIGLTLQAHYELEPVGGSTRLNFNVNWMGANLAADKKQGMMAGQATNLELFKKVCETNPV